MTTVEELERALLRRAELRRRVICGEPVDRDLREVEEYIRALQENVEAARRDAER